jgi:hypothetical protein
MDPLIITTLVFLFAAVVLTVLIVYFIDPSPPTPAPASQRPSSLQRANPRALDIPFLIENGMPFIRVHINGQEVRCVPDTGSPDLNIASDRCNGCDERNGTVTHRDGLVESTVKYSTQHDIVHENHGMVKIGQREAEIPFLMTVKRQITPNSMNLNVCGLLDAGRGGGVLPHILPPNHFMMFSFSSRGDGGRLRSVARGSPDALFQNFAIVTPWVRHGPNGKHFVVAVDQIDAESPVQAPCRLKYALLDTGSNTSSLPPCAFQALSGHMRRNETLNITFKNNAHRPLLLSHENYRNHSHPQGLLTLDDRIGNVGDNDTMLLGAPAFRGCTILFTDTHLCIRPSGF